MTRRRSGIPPPRRGHNATQDWASATRREMVAGGPADASRSPGLDTVVVAVRGMTCRSCEVRIERILRRLGNVERVEASAVSGRVVVTTSGAVPPRTIEAAVKEAGYEVGRTPWLDRDPRIWATAVSGAILVTAFAVLAQATGVTDLASAVGDLRSGGLLVALMLGLAAGVSTCAAIVGGLMLALSASFEAPRREALYRGQGVVAHLRPALVFTGGRIVGYGVLGAALGAVGATFIMPPQLTAVLMIAVAVVMTLLGTRLTGVSPRMAAWSPTLPSGLPRRLGLAGRGAHGYSDGRAAVLGAASFLLPCGFTQAVQIYSLSTGSPLLGGAIMAVFAIGTAPGLLALAGFPAVLPDRARPTLLRLTGVVVVGFAVLNGGAGLQLAAATFRLGASPVVAVVAPDATSAPETPRPTPTGATPTGSGAFPGQSVKPRPSATPPPEPTLPSVQELDTYQDVDGYGPADATILAGIPTRWSIDSRSSQTCAAYLIVPDLEIGRYLLQAEPNVIELPPLRPGTLDYTCSMGMFWASITIVDPATGMADAGG